MRTTTQSQRRGIALMLLSISVGLWACSERNAEPHPTLPRFEPSIVESQSGNGEHSNPLAYVGQLHNEAMEHVRVSLRTAAQSKGARLTRAETFFVVESSLDEFFRMRGVGRLHPEDMQISLRFLTDRHQASGQKLLADVSVLSGGVTVSPRVYEFVDQIVYLTDQADYHRSTEVLRVQLIQLEQAAASELSGTDLEAVYATASVAISSAEYWPANAQYWADLCGTDITCYPPGGGCDTVCDPLNLFSQDQSSGVEVGKLQGDAGDGGSVNQMVNGWRVLGADVVGAFGGFLMGGWAGSAIVGGVSSTNAVIMLL